MHEQPSTHVRLDRRLQPWVLIWSRGAVQFDTEVLGSQGSQVSGPAP